MSRFTRALLALAAVVTAVVVVGVTPASAAVNPVQPDRVLDTRIGLGASGPVGPGRVVTLPIGAAAGATSVVLNLTATEASAPGWARVIACAVDDVLASRPRRVKMYCRPACIFFIGLRIRSLIVSGMLLQALLLQSQPNCLRLRSLQ